ncbi:MAG: 2-oxoacid:acceptor oxidoreductase subunit alpha, partial [Chloroflexi bacterium]|nr:2-oxoacid:acceptor oxidoreductase subunit alpha [Chloroflexota bacterium]
EDSLYQAIAAFNMAERYQVPVIFLSDQSLSYRTESIDWPDVSKIAVENRLTVDGEASEGYARYALTETGISPTAIPGHEGTMHTAPGLEHDEYGHPRWEPELHTAMMEKRARKLEIAERELGPVPRYGVNDPKLGIISWGSTEGPIREAIDMATAEGYKVAALHPRVLHPLPRKQLEEFISSVQHVLVPELNYSGQFAQYLAATFGFKPIRLNKYGGVPFAAGEIYQKIIEVLS